MKPDCEHEPNTHCIHSSERRSFRSCRRRWDYAFRQHYTPETSPKPLEFGIAFHRGMEAVYDPDLWEVTNDEEKLDNAIEVFAETCREQRKRYLEATHQTNSAEPFGDDYNERIELGVGMLTYYVREVHPTADVGFKPVAVEVPFSIPLTLPSGVYLPDAEFRVNTSNVLQCINSPNCGQQHDNPADITLNGRVDALFEDLVNGGYYLVDWKSAKDLIKDGEHLQLDDQITSYVAALYNVLNLNIKGFLYSEIRKDYPKPLKELGRPYKGKLLSTDARQMTTYDIALSQIKEKDLGAYKEGKYNEYLAELKNNPPKFHQRFPVLQSSAKLKNVLDNVSMEAIMMTDPNVFITPSPSKMNCQGCAYKAPCLAAFNDENPVFTLESLFGKKVYEDMNGE